MRSQDNDFHYSNNSNSNSNNNNTNNSTSHNNYNLNITYSNENNNNSHINVDRIGSEHYFRKSNKNLEDSKIGAYCTLRKSRLTRTPIPAVSSSSSSSINKDDSLKIDLPKLYVTNKKFKNLIKSSNSISAHCNSTNNIVPTLSYSKLHEFGELGSLLTTSTSPSSSSPPASESSANNIISNFGISKDLSTESIKNVCDCYEEIDDNTCENENNIYENDDDFYNDVNNDDESNIVQKESNKNCQQERNRNSLITNQAINKSLLNRIDTELNHNYNKYFKRLSPLRYSTLDRRKMIKDHFHPYCTIRREKDQNNSIENSNGMLSEKSQQTGYHYCNNSSVNPTNLNHFLLNNNKNNNNDNDNNKNDENVLMTTAVTEHPRDGSVTSTEAFNILNELDAILNNHSSSSTPSLSRNQIIISPIPLSIASLSPSSSPVPINKTNKTESITTEKVEDCLLELDEYLEEIDNQNDNNDDQFDDDKRSILSIPQSIQIQQFQRSKTLPKKRSHLQHQSNVNEDHLKLFNKSSLSKIIPNEINFVRGNRQFRNTIGGNVASTNNRSSNSKMKASSIDDGNNITNKDYQKNWRRRSMRKTSLFMLPDQKEFNGEEISHKTSQFNQQEYDRINQIHDLDTIQNIQTNSLPCTPSHQTIATSSSSPISNQQISDDNNAFTNEGYQAASDEIGNSSLEPFSDNNIDTRRCISQENCSNRHQNLSHIDIICDLLRNASQNTAQGRPKQLGRRADQHPRIVSIMAETNPLSGNQRIIVNHDRPSSAPAAATVASSSTNRISISSPLTSSDCSRYIGSEPSSVGSSRNPSPVSLLSSTASSSTTSAPDQTVTDSHLQQRTTPPEPPLNNHHIHVPSRSQGNNSQWPHGFSRILALLCCTLGLFNISRFSILTIHYGGNFLLQFLLLSIIFGIPMLWLQMSLGAKIKSGPVSMWKISPICKGIGISLIIAQCVIALYSTVSLGWVMVYLRDSFISRNEYYRWQEAFSIYRRSNNGSIIGNNLTETVSDYFNGIVLQRWQLSLGRRGDTGGVRFQLAFNLAVIWTVVFVVLCKGLKSFGKIVLGLTLIPIMLFIVITCKMLYIIDFSSVQNIFLASDFEDFLINSKTWTAAAQETFLTWTLLGPSIIAISSKSAEKTESKTILRRDAVLVVIITLFGLSLAAIFGFACVQILHNNDYLYIPGSYENLDSYTFVYSLHGSISPHLLSIPIKWTPHYSSVLGECYRRLPTSVAMAYRESGYQALRLVTELFPSTVAVATQESISSVWSIVTFLMFLLFGLGQLCAMWKPISSALGDSTSSVLLSCVTGLLLGIPFATEMGLSIIHYLDTVLGGAWWILILWTAEIFAVFLVRGRPYNGDDLVKDLRMSGSMSAFLALSWNVLLPVGLITLAIIEYKISLSSQFFHWRNKSYFPLWTRKVGGFIQIGFLMVIPVIAIIQIYRYLTSGPPDILDRIQLLYRPSETPPPHRRNRYNPERSPAAQNGSVGITLTPLDNPNTIHDDAPPKYTPPPSYTTATGARIAKLLRQSIRRSVRRILGESSHNRPSISTASHMTAGDSSLPPEYSTVLSNPSGSTDIETGPRILYNSHTQSQHQQTNRHQNSTSIIRPLSETLSRSTRTSSINRNRHSPSYTAFDVAQILRPSSSPSPNRHHERSISAVTTGLDHVLRSSSLKYNHNKSQSRSAENLVLNAAPLGQSNAIILADTSLNAEETTDNNNENTSVI